MVDGVVVWSRDHLARLVDRAENQLPVIPAGSVVPMVEGWDLWDLWPFRHVDGEIFRVGGRQWWAGLSAPAVGDPGHRHNVARIRVVSTDGAEWRDHGPLFPEGASLGSREWAGACVVEGDRLVVYYTAAGVRGEPSPTFRQRIVTTSARLSASGSVSWQGWERHEECIVADGYLYQIADQAHGEAGFIKAFRDPFPFRDPATGVDHLLFTGSQAGAATDFNGAIGLATRRGGAFSLEPPLVTADGVNNELERPHVVVVDGLYYLFFSTQRRTFHPEVSGPTGLYGFVGRTLQGPFRALNGSGLVLSNPQAEPFQAYSWMVLGNLEVTSFVDSYALGGAHPDDFARTGDLAALRRHFGGTMAPRVRLRVSGDRAYLEG